MIRSGDPSSSLFFKLQALASLTLLYLPSFDLLKENEVGKIRGNVRAEVAPLDLNVVEHHSCINYQSIL